MKKVVLVLLLCFGVMACAVEQDGVGPSTETELTEEEVLTQENKLTPEVMEMFKVGGDVETQACSYLGAEPCNGTTNCGFECCSGEVRLIQEVCGRCIARANSWCGSGTRRVFWY